MHFLPLPLHPFPAKKILLLSFSYLPHADTRLTHPYAATAVDTDMDIDIPHPEELEWLEANNSNVHDDFFDDDDPQLPTEPYSDDEYEEEEPDVAHLEDHHPQNFPVQQSPPTKPNSSIPPKPANPPPFTQPQSSSATWATRKRFRFNDPDSFIPNDVGPSDDKRSRIIDPESEIDEDWLPPPLPPPQAPRSPPPRVEEKILSRYASEIDGDYVPITGLDGERVYAKICTLGNESRLKRLDFKGQSNGLIMEPINILMQRVENLAMTKALQASVDGQSEISLQETPVATEQLWVDKYAPNSFMELLSDEQTNREVLLWLKQWDSCVFGSEIKSTTDDVLSSLKRHSSISQHQKLNVRSSFGKTREPRLSKETFKVHNDLIAENNDKKNIQELWNKKQKGSDPLEQKILLLCGPPGLGKTTLAHVAARHCGYRVVEINASDDRSSSTIEAKILDVVQMNSVMADSKPKCLVIDEIDGALGDGKGAVEVILKMLSNESKTYAGKENEAQEEQSGSKSSKKKQKAATLLRPVICICNDLYAPALRPLRQVAKVHIFVQPTVSRVVSRLKYICNKEGLKTSSAALTALVQYTECDVRSCLNTLQFLNRRKENLNVLEISSQVVGRKDTSRSVFDIWKEIFQKRRIKRARKSVIGYGSMSSEFDVLHSLIANRGDYDLILDGIHENMLQLYYHDPVMQKTVKCFHSLGVSDMINQYIMRTQRMSLQVYQPPIVVAIHGIISQVEKPNVDWPKSYQRHRTILTEKTEILHSWHNRISPYISRHLSVKSFVEDSVSLLLHILSPPTLRPVALHLLSEKEKNDLAQLVNTMLSYAITYNNMKSDSLPSALRHDVAIDASALSFDPPIANFINFKGYKSNHLVLGLAVRQVLVHEVEKQKILHGNINRSVRPTSPHKKENQFPLGNEKVQAQSSRSSCTTAHAMKMVPVNNLSNQRALELISSDPTATGSSRCASVSVKIKSPEKTKKPSSGQSNFFDRFKKASSKCSQNSNHNVKDTATIERDSRPLLFKFNEGFTNAVKRPVRIREFLT